MSHSSAAFSFSFLAWLLLLAGSNQAQQSSEAPIDRAQIDAALKLTQAAAKEYEIVAASDGQPLELNREPVLRWSNPAVGEIHGNVFLWTQGGRPMVVGSLYKWFTPHTHMSHEFQSLSEHPIGAKFHGEDAWKTSVAGLGFKPVPQAASPAATTTSRLLQLKQIARDFAATKKERDGSQGELRLLPQPIYRYALPKDGLLDGALFAFVQGTDPELFLLLEARYDKDKQASWQFAATRMNGVELRLRHRDREVWSADAMPWREIYDHRQVYTSFLFKQIPVFLSEALETPTRQSE